MFRFGESDSGEANAKSEAAAWKTIWGFDAQVRKLLGQYCVFMPFAFHFCPYPDTIRWCPMSLWNCRVEQESWGAFFSSNVEQDSCLSKDVVTKGYLDEPLKVAEEALNHMHNTGLVLEDEEVKWDHIGLLPVFKKSSNTWTVKPVVIDLTRLRIVTGSEKEYSLKMQIEILKNAMPKSNALNVVATSSGIH